MNLLDEINAIYLISAADSIYGVCKLNCYLTTISPITSIKKQQIKFLNVSKAKGKLPSKGLAHTECAHDIKHHGKKHPIFKNKIIPHTRINPNASWSHNVSHGAAWIIYFLLSF